MNQAIRYDGYEVSLDALYRRMWELAIDDQEDGTRLYSPRPGRGEALKWLIADQAGIPATTGKSSPTLQHLRQLVHRNLQDERWAERISQTSFRLLVDPGADKALSAAEPVSDPEDSGQAIDGVAVAAVTGDGSSRLALGGLEWSDWVSLSTATAQASTAPGVYCFRSEGQIVYIGMAGERRGMGIRGRLRVYARGRGAVSGFGEAALDRALADPDWLDRQLDDLRTKGPARTKDWAIAALVRVPFDVCWSGADSAVQAREWETRILEELEDLELWKRARPKHRSDSGSGK